MHTIIAALAAKNIDGRTGLRFLEYRDLVPDMYGNALMLTPTFLKQHPDAARAGGCGQPRHHRNAGRPTGRAGSYPQDGSEVRRPCRAPVGVYMVMDVSPSVIILPAASPVRQPT